ncbi:hypothetical protein CMEL01_07927 [Colletotrichum melonis]|uniref:Uncharacterized protein n=1 Tax=Colletotrichum melonis TaxID=1209925 RepID=A0AAI9U2L0_9PEZI|nr:hypothetical protein CMEL01_07927 [Colletotrichum melonis]
MACPTSFTSLATQSTSRRSPKYWRNTTSQLRSSTLVQRRLRYQTLLCWSPWMGKRLRGCFARLERMSWC